MKLHPNRIKKSLRKDHGYSIVELMAVVVLSTIVFIGAYIAISTFFLKFQQIQRISVLNREAYECKQILKNGITVEVYDDTHFMGITNCDSATLQGNYVGSGGRSEILLKPPSFHSLNSESDFIEISLNRGYVVYDKNVYGSSYTQTRDQYIFPKLKNNRHRLIEVTNLVFRNADPESLELKIVKVELEARIEISRDKDDNPEWYYVNYETLIAIGKMQ